MNHGQLAIFFSRQTIPVIHTHIHIHCRKRKVSATAGQEKSSNKLEVPAARKRKRKGSKCSELKHTEDNNISGSSGADDNAQEVKMIRPLLMITLVSYNNYRCKRSLQLTCPGML